MHHFRNLFFFFSLLVTGTISIGGNHKFGNIIEPTPNITRPTEFPCDTAKVYVILNYQANYTVSLWGISSNCYQCLFQLLTNNVSTTFLQVLQPIDTTFPFQFQVKDSKDNIVGSFSYQFGDGGVYTITINTANPSNSKISEDLKPYNVWIPLIVAGAVLFSLAGLYILGLFLFRRYKNVIFKENNDYILLSQKEGEESSEVAAKKRIASLDIFRGICITVMVFVNYGGGRYWFFNHSRWNGLTWADLVFPWFIWIMGTAMAISYNSLEVKKIPKSQLLYKAVRRSIILFALGLFVNNGYYLETFRILGVLQRFAVAYLVVSLILIFIPKYNPKKVTVQTVQDENENTDEVVDLSPFRDITPYWIQWIVALIILGAWFLITFASQVEGCPRGYIGPGGIGDEGKYPNCTGGIARIIDLTVFGEKHIFQSPTCHSLYHCLPYDPEGILGNLTSIFLCWLGLQSGRILVCYKDHYNRIKRLIVWGIFWGVLATILCYGRENGGLVPLNKNLWSASFVFAMGGTGFLSLALLYFIVDVNQWWNGTPFIFVGMNSIIIYVGHETLGDRFPFRWDAEETHAAKLWENIFGVACWMVIAYRMYQLRFFVNI